MEPYINEEGRVICVHNHTKRTIHPLAPAEYETVSGKTRRESLCGKQPMMGGEYTNVELIKLDPEQLTDEYVRDEDGEILGKRCSHCASKMDLPV